MDKVGILIISKSLGSSAMIDTFMRSDEYDPEFYVAESQTNPFNLDRAKVHRVIPDLNIDEIVRFAGRYKKRIAFGLSDNENFVTEGGRDRVERGTGIQMVCVTRKYAIERSKADQRLLFDEIIPDANPRYKVFDPRVYRDESSAVEDLKETAADFDGLVIKPDAPARGAGVGVSGSDFTTEGEMVCFFRNAYSNGRVVVEEKVEGEESSFQAFSDGRHFVAAPLARDYKRAFDRNQGRLTGGMGSYRDAGPSLPFLSPPDRERVVRAERTAFERWKGKGSNPELRGLVLYDALMHTGGGFKILERNSRGGNTEQVNLLTTMEDDFVDVCYRMTDGTLRGIRFRNEASVVTCAVPLDYGTPGISNNNNRKVDLRRAYELCDKYDGRLRVFPMDVRLKDGKTWIGTSRSVAVVGTGDSLDTAREISLQGVGLIDGPLRHRSDIASKSDIWASLEHLRLLRGKRRTKKSTL